MSTPVTYNGQTYFVPAFGDGGYAQGAGNLSLYLIALASGSLTTAGGIFTLTADVNFGTSFGLIAKYYKSTTANPATSGSIRLANTDTINWRNGANTDDLRLGATSTHLLMDAALLINPVSDQLILGTAGGAFGVTITAPSPAGASRTVTIPDLGANYSIVGTEGTQTINGSKTINTLILGGTENANSNKIINLTNGSAASDAAAFGQIPIVATQANQEAATSTTVFVSPGRQQYHPSSSKFWVNFIDVAGTVTINASYNVTSVTRISAGNYSIMFTIAFSSANYAILGSALDAGSGNASVVIFEVLGTASVSFVTVNPTNLTASNTAGCYVVGFGDQ